MEEHNTNNRNIHLTFSYHTRILSFLDLQTSLKNKFDKKTFRKKRGANTLLQAKSHHPPSLIRGIPVGPFLRIRRNCSTMDNFYSESQKMYTRFRERGYSHQCIRKARKRAFSCDRLELLQTTQVQNLGMIQTNSPARMITRCGS